MRHKNKNKDKNNNKIKIIFLGFFLLLFFFVFKVNIANSLTLEEIQQKLNELNERKRYYEEKKQELGSKLFEKRSQIKDLISKINYIDSQIEKLQNEIYILELDIERQNLKIEEKKLLIEKTLKKISLTKNIIGEILNQMREVRFPLIYIFFSSYSISDFSKKIITYNTLNTYLISKVRELKALKKELENEKKALELEKIKLEDLKNTQKVKKYALSIQKNEKIELYKKTKGEEALFKKHLSEVEKEIIKVIKEILALEEEAKRLRNFQYYVSSGRLPKKGTKIFKWPLPGGILTQNYGYTGFAKKGYYGGKIHNGIDIASGFGSPIYAAAKGKVIGKNTKSCPNYKNYGCQGGWGNWIAILHPNNVVTLYAHMLKPSNLKIGDIVDTNTLLGYEGASGLVTGSHLHFSVYTEFFITDKGWPGYNPEGTVNPLWYL